MELPPNPTEWYMQLLAPLSPDIKLDLICKLAESLKEKHCPVHGKRILPTINQV